MPKVSIIIPCYNQGKFLDETVDSVLAQTFDDFEIVIVNDGSSDDFTNDLLRDFHRPKTRVIQTDNQGVSAARNTAIRAATGSYILPLDGDDLLGREYLQKGVAILDGNSDVGIVSCLIEFFGDVCYQPEQPPFTVEGMLVRNVVGPCSSLFRKSDWEQIGGYSTTMTSGWEDWDFWLSFVERGAGIVRIPEVLFYYRIRDNSRERSLALEGRVEMFMQLYENHRELYHQHMKSIFRELCAYQELLCSRKYRLLEFVDNPSNIASMLYSKASNIVKRKRTKP